MHSTLRTFLSPFIVFAIALYGLQYIEVSQLTLTVFTAVCLIAAYLWYDIALELATAQIESTVQGKQRSPRPESIWDSQHALMMSSDQLVSDYPRLTKTSILYGALIIEEVGETLVALGTAISEASTLSNYSTLKSISEAYIKNGIDLQNASQSYRDVLAKCTEEPFAGIMKKTTAIELLDGCTDIHVVTAGLSLACGLPGGPAYYDTVSSNLSKANPATGKIDKTPDGKWIKGVNYKKPDLSRILDSFYAKS